MSSSSNHIVVSSMNWKDCFLVGSLIVKEFLD